MKLPVSAIHPLLRVRWLRKSAHAARVAWSFREVAGVVRVEARGVFIQSIPRIVRAIKRQTEESRK